MYYFCYYVGATVLKSVSSKTDYLICGDNDQNSNETDVLKVSNKLKEAVKQNVPVMHSKDSRVQLLLKSIQGN